MRLYPHTLGGILLLLCGAATAAEPAAADARELSQRVEELKLESVNLARDVWLFEQSLGGDAGQVVVFLSADPALAGSIEQIELDIGDETIARHEYSATEAEALRKGGAHRLYTASLEPGRHVLEARISARGDGGKLRETAKLSFRTSQDPKTIELRLQPADAGAAELTVREWD
jgi:hypothetical protein